MLKEMGTHVAGRNRMGFSLRVLRCVEGPCRKGCAVRSKYLHCPRRAKQGAARLVSHMHMHVEPVVSGTDAACRSAVWGVSVWSSCTSNLQEATAD